MSSGNQDDFIGYCVKIKINLNFVKNICRCVDPIFLKKKIFTLNMNKYIYFILGIIIFSVASHAFTADKPFMIVPEKVDFKSVPHGKLLTTTIEVKNMSDSELKLVQVSKSCNCTTVEYDKGGVAPFSSAFIRLSIDTSVLSPANKRASIYMNVSVKDNMYSVPIPIRYNLQEINNNYIANIYPKYINYREVSPEDFPLRGVIVVQDVNVQSLELVSNVKDMTLLSARKTKTRCVIPYVIAPGEQVPNLSLSGSATLTINGKKVDIPVNVAMKNNIEMPDKIIFAYSGNESSRCAKMIVPFEMNVNYEVFNIEPSRGVIDAKEIASSVNGSRRELLLTLHVSENMPKSCSLEISYRDRIERRDEKLSIPIEFIDIDNIIN